MKQTALLYVLLLAFGSTALGQTFEPDALKARLDTLSDKDKVHYIIDNFYSIYSADFDQAIYWTEDAIRLSNQNGWPEQEGQAYLKHGVAKYLRGDYPAAIKDYIQSENIFDSLGNDVGIANVNNEMAVFYSKNEEYEKAFAALDRSEKASIAANDQEALGTSYSNRGAIMSKLGNIEEAMPYFEKVLEIRSEQKDSVGLGYIYLDFSEYAMTKGKIEEAIDWVKKSTDIRKAIRDEQGVAVNHVIMGEIYYGAEQYDKAIPFFKQTIELATPTGYTDLIKFTYGMLQQSYKNLGRFQDAYENQSQQMAFQDSLLNVEKTKAIAELETRYETAKKEQQIVEEQAKNRISLIIIIGLSVFLILAITILLLLRSRSRKKEQLILQKADLQLKEAEIAFTIRSQEEERARYAKDLHDGFGQMISILNLNLKSLEKDKADRHQVFESSTAVLNDMYSELKSICFNLMPQTLIKNGITAALQEIALRIRKTGHLSVETDFFGLEERLPQVVEISLYRITQEWVNNVLKYGKAENITVQLTRENSELTLLIEDNGPGFDAELLTESESGNGWKNIHSRANLIKGTISLDTQMGRKGNTFILEFDLENLNQHVEKPALLVEHKI